MPSKTRKQKKGGAFLLGRSLMAAASLGMLPTAHGNHSHEPHEYHPIHFPHMEHEHEHEAFNLGSYRVPESHRVVYIQTIPVTARARTSGRSKKARTRAKSKKSATRRSKSKSKSKRKAKTA